MIFKGPELPHSVPIVGSQSSAQELVMEGN